MNTATRIDAIAAAWVAREDKQPLDPGSVKERDDWLAADLRHRGAYIRAHAVFLRAGRASALGRGFGETPALRAGIQSRGRHRRWWVGVATAAVLSVVALGLRPLPTGSGAVSYRTGLGEVLRVPLKDGSVMTLNSGTEVSVQYSYNERRVTLLQGESLFKVASDTSRPFSVETDGTEVVAVGTSFSVRKEAGDAFVVLVNEGVVDIRQPQHWLEPLRVHANYSAVANHGSGVRIEPLSQYEIGRRLAWREGLLSFEGTTLADAAKEFSRYSDIRIVIEDPDVAQRRVVGVYSSADPEGFAKAVAASMGLQVEKTPDGVYLRASW